MTAAALDYQTRLSQFDLGETAPAPSPEEKRVQLRARRAEQQQRQDAEALDRGYRYAFAVAAHLTPERRAEWYAVHLKIDGPHSLGHLAGIAAQQRRSEVRARLAVKRAELGIPAGGKARRLSL